jgi:hypothetical protein
MPKDKNKVNKKNLLDIIKPSVKNQIIKNLKDHTNKCKDQDCHLKRWYKDQLNYFLDDYLSKGLEEKDKNV